MDAQIGLDILTKYCVTKGLQKAAREREGPTKREQGSDPWRWLGKCEMECGNVGADYRWRIINANIQPEGPLDIVSLMRKI